MRRMRWLSGLGLVGVVCLLAAGHAKGVEISDRGAVFDLSFAKLDGTVLSDSRFGVRVGGFVCTEVSDTLTVRTEFALAMKGGEDPSDDDAVNITYLEVPVLFTTSLSQGTSTPGKPYVFGGPYVGLRFSAEDEDGVDLSDDVEVLDLGLVIGAGVEFDVGKNKLSASLRYSLGISDIDTGGGGVKNKVLSLGVGYSF